MSGRARSRAPATASDREAGARLPGRPIALAAKPQPPPQPTAQPPPTPSPPPYCTLATATLTTAVPPVATGLVQAPLT